MNGPERDYDVDKISDLRQVVETVCALDINAVRRPCQTSGACRIEWRDGRDIFRYHAKAELGADEVRFSYGFDNAFEEEAVLESYLTEKREKAAALKFIKKAMKRLGRTKAVVTDRCRSYGAALKEIGAVDLQETGRRLNNRCENSHLPFRRRERAMQRFRRMKTLQKFSSVHVSVTTTSIRIATSSADKITKPDAQLPWLIGSPL